MTVKTNKFALRQTADSPFSHFTGTWEELEAIVLRDAVALDSPHVRQGYRPGVLLVSVDPTRFYSGVVTLTAETRLEARFAARRPGEQSFAEVLARGEKTPAVAVEVVLYSRALLAEEGELTEADYEIVSINARTSVAPEPMTPIAMARNFLELAGGTKASYTAEQFAESIAYWSTRAMYGGA